MLRFVAVFQLCMYRVRIGVKSFLFSSFSVFTCCRYHYNLLWKWEGSACCEQRAWHDYQAASLLFLLFSWKSISIVYQLVRNEKQSRNLFFFFLQFITLYNQFWLENIWSMTGCDAWRLRLDGRHAHFLSSRSRRVSLAGIRIPSHCIPGPLSSSKVQNSNINLYALHLYYTQEKGVWMWCLLKTFYHPNTTLVSWFFKELM